MLTCRELRQARQKEWLARYSATLISVTIVAPGPIKDSKLTRQIFNLACSALQQLSDHENWRPLAAETFDLPTGAEALIALAIPAEAVKRKVVELEQNHPVGRLWDIDVIDSAGRILSRTDSGMPTRRCLVCNEDARICGRSRAHSFEALTKAMEILVENVVNSARPNTTE